MIAANGANGLAVWNVRAGKLMMKDNGRVTAFAFSPDNKLLVAGYSGGKARLHRFSYATSMELPWPVGASDRASAEDATAWLKYSADGRFLIAGQSSGRLLIWRIPARYDLVSPDTEAGFPGSFTPDGRFFATFDARRSALTFVDLGSFQKLGVSIPVQGDISGMHLSSDLRWLLSRQPDVPPRLIELNQGLFQEREELTSSLCRERLRGSTRVTPYDETAAPILNGRVGEDVCAPPTFTSRWRNFLGSF